MLWRWSPRGRAARTSLPSFGLESSGSKSISRSRWCMVRVCWTGFFLVSVLAPSFAAPDVTLYVSPEGDDADTGLSPDAAFQTIQHAASRAKANKQAGHETLVLIQPGIYREQIAMWRANKPYGQTMTFQAEIPGRVLAGAGLVRNLRIARVRAGLDQPLRNSHHPVPSQWRLGSLVHRSERPRHRLVDPGPGAMADGPIPDQLAGRVSHPPGLPFPGRHLFPPESESPGAALSDTERIGTNWVSNVILSVLCMHSSN